MKMFQSARGRAISYFLPPVVWALLIFLESSIPASAIPESEIFRWDKLIHLCIYFVFALLIYRALSFEGVSPKLRSFAAIITVFVIALFGASDEYHQHFVPGRSMDLFDWIADTLGAVLLIGFQSYLIWRKSRQKSRN
jgi:VanZ family protein